MGFSDRVRQMLGTADRMRVRRFEEHHLSFQRSDEARARVADIPPSLCPVAGAAPAGRSGDWTVLSAGTVLYQPVRYEDTGALSWDDGFSRSFRSASWVAVTETAQPQDGAVVAYVLREDVALPLLGPGVTGTGAVASPDGSVENALDDGTLDWVQLPSGEGLEYVATYDVSGNQIEPYEKPWGYESREPAFASLLR